MQLAVTARRDGRIVRADLGGSLPGAARPAVSPAPDSAPPPGVPFETIGLSNMRRTIARRLTDAKRTVPHIYLTVDIGIDALLKLRAELNRSLDERGVKLSVNDMLLKAQAAALMEVPSCNVQFTGEALIRFRRCDIAVAVSVPGGLITPVVTSADAKSLSAIATEMKDLAARARTGGLAPHEYDGGTASLSNSACTASSSSMRSSTRRKP